MKDTSRRWGDDRALLDDDEARRLLLDAASRCIVRRGNTQIRMAEVAQEAGVVRSTVYRYFPGREDLVLGLVLMRIDAALAALVRSLRNPGDATKCLPKMVLGPADCARSVSVSRRRDSTRRWEPDCRCAFRASGMWNATPRTAPS